MSSVPLSCHSFSFSLCCSTITSSARWLEAPRWMPSVSLDVPDWDFLCCLKPEQFISWTLCIFNTLYLKVERNREEMLFPLYFQDAFIRF